METIGRHRLVPESSRPIVVGIDGSEGARRAVEWAVDDAHRKGRTLRLIHAMDHREPYDLFGSPAAEWPHTLTRKGRRLLVEAERLARERRPDVEITSLLLEGDPGIVLRAQGRIAAEIVVGSRGLGGLTGAVLGSVSGQVAGQAHCPVVVVRPGSETVHDEVVVGVDGSPECEPALRYAFEEAELRGCPLRALYAWQLPVHAFAPEITYDMDEVHRARHQVVQERLAGWREKYPTVRVVEDVRCADPVDALVEASARADLTVVGSHGRGVIGSLVLGSVSRGVLHRAHGPVAVVRA